MAITVNIFNQVPERLALYGAIQKTNTIGIDTRCPLFVILRSVDVSTFNAAASGQLSNVADNEIATGNGYTKGGKALENVRFSYTSGVLALLANDTAWAATGGSIVAKSALLCYELPVAKHFSGDYRYTSVPLAMIDFGGTETVVAGISLVVQWPADGIFKWQLA